MPSVEAPQQQQPMEAQPQDAIITQQPATEPQPEMTLRGGFMEECSCCCFSEECGCC
ncbi:hypothetical protein QBC46DRAFT_336619 [Diplogelasinospora grovesii]|uniref:Uncharacterized protein n=1 Tax=Diplogelasinospora grovesii TaxID=303347 RepID=A0AAN6S9E1_9PEZI|nr:hypothetical protein QBC46DRAFT_336619 [Diplogelasinospora grovesii]